METEIKTRTFTSKEDLIENYDVEDIPVRISFDNKVYTFSTFYKQTESTGENTWCYEYEKECFENYRRLDRYLKIIATQEKIIEIKTYEVYRD